MELDRCEKSMPETGVYLSIKALAKETKMSEKFWRMRIHNREIEFVQMGRKIMIPRKALKAFLDKYTVPALDREALKSEFRGRL